MRTVHLLSIVPLFVVAACDDSSTTADPTVEAVTAALSASEAEGDGQALGALAFPRFGPAAGGRLTGAERVARLKSFIKERLTCAEAVGLELENGGLDTADELEVTFSKDCTWMGRRWTGTVTITWTEGGDSAAIDFEGVAVNGATLTGTMTVTRIEEGHVTVEADWTRVGLEHTVTGAWDGDYAWTDTTYTVNSATHAVTVDGSSATRVTTGVVWQKDDVAPEAGSVTFTGFHGKTFTMVYGRDESGALTVTVTGPNGKTRVFYPGSRGDVVAE